MKLVLLLFFLAFTGVAQTSAEFMIEHLNDLITKRVKWNSISRNTFTPLEKQVITNLIKDSSNAFCTDPRIDGDYYEDFHLIDLDGDKDMDIVFEGLECGGYSSKTVLVYMNRNGAYKKTMAFSGRIVMLNQGSDLTLYKYPCCSMIENTMITYTIKTDSLVENFGLDFFYSPALSIFSKDYELIIPKKLKTGNKYEVKAATEINYVPQDSLQNPMFIKQSLAGSINAEATVTSYSSIKDKEGMEWLYCKVPKGAVILKNNNPVEYSLMIWIKQKDCVKLN